MMVEMEILKTSRQEWMHDSSTSPPNNDYNISLNAYCIFFLLKSTNDRQKIGVNLIWMYLFCSDVNFSYTFKCNYAFNK